MIAFSRQTVLCHLALCAEIQALACFNYVRDIASEANKQSLMHLNSDTTECYI